MTTFLHKVPISNCQKIEKYMYFQGIFYVIVIYGLSVLRVCYGPLHIFLCNMVVFLVGYAILFLAITVAMYTFTRFMFVCVWKRMRQMDDNFIVRIATIQALAMSLLFMAVPWFQINGQRSNIQVSFSLFLYKSAYYSFLDITISFNI